MFPSYKTTTIRDAKMSQPSASSSAPKSSSSSSSLSSSGEKPRSAYQANTTMVRIMPNVNLLQEMVTMTDDNDDDDDDDDYDDYIADNDDDDNDDYDELQW